MEAGDRNKTDPKAISAILPRQEQATQLLYMYQFNMPAPTSLKNMQNAPSPLAESLATKKQIAKPFTRCSRFFSFRIFKTIVAENGRHRTNNLNPKPPVKSQNHNWSYMISPKNKEPLTSVHWAGVSKHKATRQNRGRIGDQSKKNSKAISETLSLYI